jgi:protein-S-isoprenylcysteine O-methyltransferase Ste14
MTLLSVGLASILILGAAYFIFARVAADYRAAGKLSPLSSFLEVLIFALHGSGSYAFLDSELSHVDQASPLFGLAVALIVIGLLATLAAMTKLGYRQSVGSRVSGLHSAGFYRFTRNPQLVAYGLLIIGYALLWPSWSGLLWVLIYAAIAHLMVRTEETHLERTYGEAYKEYCARTPRYLGLPGK